MLHTWAVGELVPSCAQRVASSAAAASSISARCPSSAFRGSGTSTSGTRLRNAVHTASMALKLPFYEAHEGKHVPCGLHQAPQRLTEEQPLLHDSALKHVAEKHPPVNSRELISGPTAWHRVHVRVGVACYNLEKCYTYIYIYVKPYSGGLPYIYMCIYTYMHICMYMCIYIYIYLSLSLSPLGIFAAVARSGTRVGWG